MKRLIRRMSRVSDYLPAYRTPAATATEDGQRQPEVPEGHVPLHVGDEMERFAVRAELLSQPALAELLARSAQEYGYQQRGVLRIPCPVSYFCDVLRSLLSIDDVAEVDVASDLD